ncbi:MAG: hypothetical protein Kow0020_00530 [Wenzhouxiangellaceae bacterium]
MFRELYTTALCALLCVAAPGLSAQEIYKYVDENGNVVYTDQKPSEDAEPLKLRELTVVEPVELGNPQVLAGQSASGTGSQARDTFSVQIVAPQPEESVWNTAYQLSVAVQTSRPLPEGAQIAYLVDGQQRALSRETSLVIDEVWRGEHQLEVEVRAADGRVLGRSEPVRFYMHQASALNPPPAARRRGGGN